MRLFVSFVFTLFDVYYEQLLERSPMDYHENCATPECLSGSRTHSMSLRPVLRQRKPSNCYTAT
jgi:hypothetical protein